MYSGCGMYIQVTPELLNSGITATSLLVHYSFLYILGLEDQFSATEDAVVHLDHFLYLCRFIASALESKLDIRSVLEDTGSLLCVCVVKF